MRAKAYFFPEVALGLGLSAPRIHESNSLQLHITLICFILYEVSIIEESIIIPS